MKKTIRKFATASIFVPLGLLAMQSAAAQNSGGGIPLEEVVVTGSYIKRSSYDDAGSPVQVFDRAAIEAEAPGGKITDIVRNIPSNYGNAASITAGADDGDIGGGGINLRGLGQEATLILLNGRRQTRMGLSPDGRININSLVPTSMIERIEVLEDGSSAIYGTDAVAGVANFITRDTFEGLELTLDGRGTPDEFSDWSSFTIAGIGGGGLGERTHVVIGAEYTEIEPLLFNERLDEVADFRGSSAFGQPGSYFVPSRDAAGALTGDVVRTPDPLCGDPSLSQPSSFLRGTQCRLYTTNASTIAREEQRWIGMARITHELSDTVTLKGEIGYGETFATSRGTFGRPVLGFPVVPGENPGNPFRAVDANGAALFAQDSDGNGVADRDASGNVILAPVPTDPASGIAFNEDVTGQFRPFSDAGSASPGAIASRQKNEERVFRQALQLDGDLSGSWSWETGWTHSSSQILQRRNPDVDVLQLGLALNGQGGSTGDEFFNPFGNALLADPSSTAYNDQDTIDRFFSLEADVFNTRLWTLDGVITGDLFDWSAGTVSVALGAQYRDEELDVDYNKFRNANVAGFEGPATDFTQDQDVWAVFAEALVPLYTNGETSLELSAAVRHEETTGDLNSTDPKVSLLFANNLVTLRASYATSFLAPTLYQRFGNLSLRQTYTDPVLGTRELRQVVINGNPNLEAQESDNLNFGITLTPIDNLEVNLDYWSFDFKDRLSTPSGQTIINADPTGPNVVRNGPSNEVVFVIGDFFNAPSLETDGIDINVSYVWPDTRFGALSIDSYATYVTSYDALQTVGGSVIDGVGFENANNVGTAVPEWKANTRLGWSRGNQSAALTLRYYSDIEQESDNDIAEGDLTVDALYTYDWGDEDGLSISVGAINLFDTRPNPVDGGNLYIENVQDPIGRRIFATLKWSL